MASGFLNRIESAFAEAALDSGWWGRALKIAETVCAGLLVAPGAALLNRARVRESMPFDMRPPTRSR
jgi:hypothetical protein